MSRQLTTCAVAKSLLFIVLIDDSRSHRQERFVAVTEKPGNARNQPMPRSVGRVSHVVRARLLRLLLIASVVKSRAVRIMNVLGCHSLLNNWAETMTTFDE
ncbi:hypothetical protein N657DRAFT_137158 [Parathielavia appendiculata]|uniref:Uncharacterized protein n=1 Tax=Parathielavia appendiculata TaxID=2587402 RepID=A0AAN6TUW4_9PEZI|nr:hypothetical protein N657DRAFT_137158 [Parathielavia appendiculata]